MQLLLASILSCAALLVGVLAQPDWKPYSSPEGGFVVSLPDEARTSTIATKTDEGLLFTHIVSANDRDLNEYMVSWTDYPRNVESKATGKAFDRMRDSLIRAREGKLTGESASMLAGRTGRAVTFTDNMGRTVDVKFYFIGQRSFEVMAESRSKEKPAKADKFFASFNVNVSESVKRELKKGLLETGRELRSERRAGKREFHDELLSSERVERAEPNEPNCQLHDEVMNVERPARVEREESRP